MKRKVEQCFICIIIFFIGGCSGNLKSKQGRSKVIDMDELVSCSFYDIFSRIDVIPLETNEDIFLNFQTGEPKKMVLNNNKFYFLEKESVVVFNSEGKYENMIHKPGKGPGEYLALSDFLVNRFTGDIEILSSMAYVNVYDSIGNEFKRTIRLPQEITAVDYFMNLTPDVYVFFANSRQGNKILYFSQKDNMVIGETYNMPDWLFMKTTLKHNRNPFYVFNDTVCFAQVYDGNIFNVLSSEPYLTSRYSCSFKNGMLDISTIPPDKDIDFYLSYVRRLKSKYAIQFFIYSENTRYYMTRFNYKNRPCHLIVDKQSNKYILFEKFKEGFQCLPLCIDEEAIYACVTPNFLNFVLNESLLDEENRIKYKSISADSNPVVIKYTFKK